MVLHHLQPSFTGGEVSPSLFARVDTSDYNTWLKKSENMYVHPQGGISNRAGTQFRGVSKNGGPCRLIPFVISEEEAYVLEVGPSYLRFYTPSGLLTTTQGTPYEISTPYASGELADIGYAQNNQTLLLAHPNHPPYQLIRTGEGIFQFEKFPLQYGPFQLANSVKTRTLRAYQTQDSIVSEGVAATLSFQPVAYSQYIVWASFNNEWFYAAADYGLYTDRIVAKFNERYSSVGLTAYNRGGVIYIESPSATGGDWNGSTLTLAYFSQLDAAPEVTVVQALSGGINEGTVIPSGEPRYELACSEGYFTPLHVGARFSLTHKIDAQYLNGTLGYESTSASIKSGGDWNVRTSGNWNGTLVVESSADLGQTWQTVKTFSRAVDEDNIVSMGNLQDVENMFLLRVRALQITGEAGFELFADSFVQEGIVLVKTYVDSQTVIVDVERAYGSSDATSLWNEGSFSPSAGYPRCVFFYQDRLGFAATRQETQTLWFSKTGKYTDFGHARLTLQDTDSISIRLAGQKLNAIRSVIISGRLLVFTAGSEWTVSGEGAFTPYTVRVEQQSEYGAYTTPVLLAGNKALFVQARGGAVRNFYYDYNSASYVSNDLSLCARHLFFNHTVREMAFAQEPDKLVWCVLDNGQLLSLTYVPEQGICAWAHHQTQGAFKSLCVIAQNGHDEVWFAVERNGTYCIETLTRRLASLEPQEQVFLDSCISKRSVTPFHSVEGLSHLEGKTVSVLADGVPLKNLTVTNGTISLPASFGNATCVHAGLAYTSKFETLPVSFSRNGTTLDQKKRLVCVTLKMEQSRGGAAGLDETNVTPWVQHHNGQGKILPLETGDFKIVLGSWHTYQPSVCFVQTDPLPVTVLACICQAV